MAPRGESPARPAHARVMTGGHLRPEVTKVGEAKIGKALMDNTAENNRTAKAEEENNIAVAKAKIRSDGIAKNNGNAKAKDTRTNEEDTMINDGTLGGHRPVRSAAVTRLSGGVSQ